MPENEIAQVDLLEIYIAYDRLKAQDLASYLFDLSELSTKIAEDYFARFDSYSGEPLPTLDIDSMQTGNSINFHLKEGWLPSVSSSKDGDIVVSVPKALGIPVLIAYLLISGANQYEDFRIKQLDLQAKELDVKLKKVELAKAIGLDGKKEQDTTITINNYIENKIPEVKPIVRRIIKTIYVNQNITQFRVNNVEIKNDKSR